MRLVSVLLALFLVSGCSSGSDADPDAGRTKEAGTPTAEPSSPPLPARWWEWVDEFESSVNPVSDTSGQSCALHQPQDVWFLAGTFGGPATRSCVIPSGRPVYFPVLNLICTVAAGTTAAEAKEDCTTPADLVRADLDGEALDIQEADSGVFTFDASQDSATGLPEGPQEAYAWGQWVGPLELTDGKHVLRFQGRAADFEVSVTYRLTVR